MPKFIPVTDVEKPRLAQDFNGAEFEKHRKFDNPFSVGRGGGKKPPMNRGWEQGNVGWGVLGAFGDPGKDECAQVIRRTDGANKMVKNEKGLWVKAKKNDWDPSSSVVSSKGQGRGSGVPLISSANVDDDSYGSTLRRDIEDDNEYDEDIDSGRFRDASESCDHRNRGRSRHDECSAKSADRSRSSSNSRDRRKSPHGQYGFRDKYTDRGKDTHNDKDMVLDKDWKHSSDRDRDERYDRDRYRGRSRDRDRDSGRGTERYRSRDEDRGKDGYRSSHSDKTFSRHDRRSDSHHSYRRSESHERRREANNDRRREERIERREEEDWKRESDRHEKKRKSRSRSDSRNRDGKNNTFRGHRRDRSRSRSRSDSEMNVNAKSRRRASDQNDVDRERERGVKRYKVDKDREVSADNAQAEEDFDTQRGSFAITFNAVQVVNRFLEVYSMPPRGLSVEEDKEDSESRLQEMSSLFTEDAIVGNMKTGKALLTGRTAISDSFKRTKATPAVCSRRLVILPLDDRKVPSSASTSLPDVKEAAGSVGFCLDFHEAGTSPGLGDRTKDTALLYRCQNALITHVWGAVDVDKIASAPSVDRATALASTCWKWGREIIKNDYIGVMSIEGNVEEKDDGDCLCLFHDYKNLEVWG